MKNKCNIKKISVIFILIIAILIVSNGVFSMAKFVGGSIWDYYLEAQGFYFSSVQLNNNVTLNNNWDGSYVPFSLSNFNDDNEVSNFDIEYEIRCSIIDDPTGNLSCELNGSGLDIYKGSLSNIKICRNDLNDGVDTSEFNESTCNSRGYTWVDGHNSLNQFFTITSSDPNQVIDNVKVKIEAESSSPYSKTIEGEFHLIRGIGETGEVTLTHESHGDYEKVVISNTTSTGKIFFLRWDSNRIRIASGMYNETGVDSSGYVNEISFTVERDQVVTFDYYKVRESSTIRETDFILVEESNIEAIRVVSMQLTESSSGVEELSQPTFTQNSTEFNLHMPSSTSTFTYKVIIENTTPDHYYLSSIDDLINTDGIIYAPLGMSLYHEFEPGTLSTFYITYYGDGTVTDNELTLKLQYNFGQGELYEDETLNGSTPEIIDGLLPILYDETLQEWVIADLVNDVWYNYVETKWANAASVVTSQREYYATAAPGTVVEMSHITSMLVWIPRFSYTINDTLGVRGYGGDPLSIETPGAIDIIFPGEDVVHRGSATYVGATPANYYTPAAFCWGNSCDDPDTRSDFENTEIKGFWIAKFEASKVNNILYSKPNMTPMINYTIADTFYYVQDLMNGVNGYNNYGYVGYVDAHLIKNTEWGAIAYLSQSKYGKYGNTAYTGANKEIYLNTCSTYITGIGGSSAADGRTTASCYDPNHMYDSYNGMGASTTGNIYGVYDMIGGTFDRVMGVVLGPNGEFIPDYSGFTELPEGRYINIYPYGTYTEGDTSPIKGDALTETLYYYSDRYLGDPRFSSTNYYLYHWIYRGGSLFFSNTDANGIFSYTLFNGIADGHHSSRFTITMYGSLVEEL